MTSQLAGVTTVFGGGLPQWDAGEEGGSVSISGCEGIAGFPDLLQ